MGRGDRRWIRWSRDRQRRRKAAEARRIEARTAERKGSKKR